MSTDWLPGSRAAILAMCRNWISYTTEERRKAWGIPEADFSELVDRFATAKTSLQKAEDEAERTHVVTVECQVAVKDLTAKIA
jgi:hypothetical protein